MLKNLDLNSRFIIPPSLSENSQRSSPQLYTLSSTRTPSYVFLPSASLESPYASPVGNEKSPTASDLKIRKLERSVQMWKERGKVWTNERKSLKKRLTEVNQESGTWNSRFVTLRRTKNPIVNRVANKTSWIGSPEKSQILKSTEISINSSDLESNPDVESLNESINTLFKCHKKTAEDIRKQKSLASKTKEQIKSLEKSVTKIQKTIEKLAPLISVNLSIPEKSLVDELSDNSNLMTRDSFSNYIFEDKNSSIGYASPTLSQYSPPSKFSFKKSGLFKGEKENRDPNFVIAENESEILKEEFDLILNDTKRMIKEKIEASKHQSQDDAAVMGIMAKSIESLILGKR
ncbi:unnamed protein product [Blepharisma stoltei]|uniref:Uncharacterized protein n=1 Tax=Blepharisma stoltei TaxID=1481888 RepID=A0AAU9JAB5_9CILI|nr:unnamed protein product [Blepharisma stoltei]